MAAYWRILGASIGLFAIVAGPAGTANALEYFTINVVNEQEFKINLELRDKNCGGGVVLRDQLEAGEAREVQICASLKGDGGVRATVGSGCSQVKRMEFIELEPGDAIKF